MNNYIEHTLLRADATVEDIIRLCEEAKEYGFCGVCINPVYVGLASNMLARTGIKTVAVVGFPLGASVTAVKELEARLAVEEHADEIDMVMNIAAAKCGEWQAVEDDIRAVVAAADGQSVKVIFEASLLTDDEKRRACQVAVDAGARFVKTSTGFGGGGATVDDVRLMKEVVGDKAQVKAAGGIRTRQLAEELTAAGATRLGTSSGVAIVKG